MLLYAQMLQEQLDTLPLEDINTGFDLMHSGESIRGVVVY